MKRSQVSLALCIAVLSIPANAPAFVAQDEGVTLRGAVMDSDTARPLSSVTILVDGWTFADTTHAQGAYRLEGLPRGPHELAFLKHGYSPRIFNFSLTEIDPDEMTVDPLYLSPGSTPTASIAGTVHDSVTGAPISAAEVSLNELASVVTDSAGAFRFDSVEINLGSNFIEFREIGYHAKRTELVNTSQHASVDITTDLVPFATMLPEVTVEAVDERPPFGTPADFVLRSRTGLGSYITRGDIERQQPLAATELLRQVPGLTVSPSGDGGVDIRILRRFNCRPEIILDGIRLNTVERRNVKGGLTVYFKNTVFAGRENQGGDPTRSKQGRDLGIDDLVNPDEIEGIEVYKGPATIPADLGMINTDCGIIVIWTRR